MDIILNGLDWKLKGFWPWAPLVKDNIEAGQDFMSVTEWLPATVPGGVHYDLYREGIIDNPYVDMNSTKCEWVENRWWMYKLSMKRPDYDGEKIELVFKGLDYHALVYINNEPAGEHKGMFEPAVFDITSIYKNNEQLDIIVLFQSTPDEMDQMGKTSMTHSQKSRFNYKWDFSTRLVNIGIWDNVMLKVHKSHSIGDLYINTDTDADYASGLIKLCADIISNLQESNSQEDVELDIKCFSPDNIKMLCEAVVKPGKDGKLNTVLTVQNPDLWYPNGYGRQPLYSLIIKLVKGADILDERLIQIGIRKLEYTYNENAPAGSLPYTIVINGKKIYVKGVNMTPVDHLYGNVADGQYDWMIRLMANANVNLVRVWGGGIIEKEIFYDLCDRHGILIWQEFIQSSSGMDSIPSRKPEFLSLLEKTAVSALKTRRNHVCLTVWSGGNELKSAKNTPSTCEDENIAILKSLVEIYDPARMFLPTSASGPVELVNSGNGVEGDVHGHWVYLGNPDHYEFYDKAVNQFHSEFGVDGASCPKSLEKFLSESYLKPVPMRESLVWKHHGEWWDTLKRDEHFFDRIDDLHTFSDCSQWIQAEGLRYIIEANSRRKFKNSGSIIWQFNEPWPNVACTCLVDYFSELKMAYYWVKKAYSPVHVSLRYEKLNFSVGEEFNCGVFIHSNNSKLPVSVDVRILDKNGREYLKESFEGLTVCDHTVRIGNTKMKIPDTPGGLIFVRLALTTDNKAAEDNFYIFSTREDKIYKSSVGLEAAKINAHEAGDWEYCSDAEIPGMIKRDYLIKNTGSEVALHIHPIETTNAFWLYTDNGYVSLFPGETQTITVFCAVKSGGGFLENDKQDSLKKDARPKIIFSVFNSV